MTEKEISDLIHIFGFLLALIFGPQILWALAIIGGTLTNFQFFGKMIGISVSSYFVVFPIVLLICLPVHGCFLKRRSYSYRKYVLLSVVSGAIIPLVLGFVDKSGLGVWNYHDVVVVISTAIIGFSTVSIFWATAMWRNGYYLSVKAWRV